MKFPKALLIGPRSRENLTYGMSIGFDLVIMGFDEKGLSYEVVDRSLGMVGRKIGSFSLGGTFATFIMLLSFWQKLFQCKVVYITIGNSTAGFLRDMLMIWPSWLFKKRIVLHLHGGGFLDFYKASPLILRKTISNTFSRVDSIIVLGELLREQFEFVPEIELKLKVVPNGLPNELSGAPYARQFKIGSEPFRLLYLSNMVPSKGYLDVLEACRILKTDRSIEIKGDFCGAFLATINNDAKVSPKEAEASFHLLVNEKGLNDVVCYHGTVRGEQKRQILQQADVFILPTSYPWEGQPISIIEALAYGLPVISTRYRGIPEQVVDGHNGFLLEKSSPEAIADAVEKLWQEPNLYEEFSHNAIKHYRQNFTREAHLNRLIPVILGQDV